MVDPLVIRPSMMVGQICSKRGKSLALTTQMHQRASQVAALQLLHQGIRCDSDRVYHGLFHQVLEVGLNRCVDQFAPGIRGIPCVEPGLWLVNRIEHRLLRARHEIFRRAACCGPLALFLGLLLVALDSFAEMGDEVVLAGGQTGQHLLVDQTDTVPAGDEDTGPHGNGLAILGDEAASRTLDVRQRAGHGGEQVGSCGRIAFAEAFDVEAGEQALKMGSFVGGRR